MKNILLSSEGKFGRRAAFLYGVSFGVMVGMLDIFLPSSSHTLLYYSAVYGVIILFASISARTTRCDFYPLRVLAIASLSMGFWAITWSLYFALFQFSQWYSVFIVQQIIGLGLNIYVPISTYIVSTCIQTGGGALLIQLTSPGTLRNIVARILKLALSSND